MKTAVTTHTYILAEANMVYCRTNKAVIMCMAELNRYPVIVVISAKQKENGNMTCANNRSIYGCIVYVSGR